MSEPKTASEYLDRGCDKDDKRDSKGAIEDYTKAIELDPNYAEAYANRGCAKEELDDKEGAIADWQKAADLGDEEAGEWIKEIEGKAINASQSTRKPDNPDALCNNLETVMIDLQNESLEDIAIALNYYYTDEQGKKVPLIDLLEEQFVDDEGDRWVDNLVDCEPNDPPYKIWEGFLIQEYRDLEGSVYVPKRLVEADPEFYKNTLLEEFDEEDSVFTEPMFWTPLTFYEIVNPSDLEDRNLFTSEQSARYHGFKDEDVVDCQIYD